eukprot:GHUV01035712.1.p1 GENE.GHUV01035712.1~~GHUV01035712.1.p1  ORF type:complete len:217 (-),score=42.11 GHUV01035712.1:94-744(-)
MSVQGSRHHHSRAVTPPAAASAASSSAVTSSAVCSAANASAHSRAVSCPVNSTDACFTAVSLCLRPLSLDRTLVNRRSMMVATGHSGNICTARRSAGRQHICLPRPTSQPIACHCQSEAPQQTVLPDACERLCLVGCTSQQLIATCQQMHKLGYINMAQKAFATVDALRTWTPINTTLPATSASITDLKSQAPSLLAALAAGSRANTPFQNTSDQR